MSIIRIHKQKNFSIISNTALYDDRLTFKAKGLWAYLLSKPDDWQVHVNQLVKAGPDGKTAIYSALKELKEFGYVEHHAIREDGKISGYEYFVNEEPEKPVNREEKLHSENLKAGILNTENPDALINTDTILKTDLNNDVQEPGPNRDNEGEDSSSSFSEIQLLSVVATLMALVPEQYRKPTVERIVERGLKAHSEAYVKNAVLYTIVNSNGGTWQKFKAYLGQCIDKHWHDGWEPDVEQVVNASIDLSFKAMSEKDLKFLADAGNAYAVEELKRRKESVSD